MGIDLSNVKATAPSTENEESTPLSHIQPIQFKKKAVLPKWERMEKNRYVYVYNWITWLYTWN